MAVDIAEWNAKSLKGELCGIIPCRQEPLTKCAYCDHYYCSMHKMIHEAMTHHKVKYGSEFMRATGKLYEEAASSEEEERQESS